MAKSRLIQQANSDVARSLQEAMSHVPAHQRRQVAAKFQALFEMYTEGHNWRVPKQFNVEGDLDQTQKFYALKVKQVRCYGWYHENNFVISHYIFKKQQKLSKADTKQVKANYRLWLIERQQYE